MSTLGVVLYRRIFLDVILPRQHKNRCIMAFRAQLQVITFITSVKATLLYNSSKLLYE